ncbi:MAG: hypothetical protein REH83_00095, partial [Rickettsiella sp.]|nr:hypothetical protein [Rickettsiella sp.]
QLAIKNREKPDAMYMQANKAGKFWRANYQAIIEKNFKQKVEFSSWKVIGTKHKTYKKSRKEIDKLYSKNSEFKSFLEEDIKEFENRHFKREGRYFTEEEKEYCRQCLKEECAALIVWDRSKNAPGYSCIYYPKKMNKAMLFIKRHYTNFMSIYAELHPNTFFSTNKDDSKLPTEDLTTYNDLTSFIPKWLIN